MNKKLLRWSGLLVVAVGVHGFLQPTALSAATWVNVTGNLANMASQCGNLTMLSAVPGSGTVIAGVALDGLWANSGGSTWSQLGTGAGSAVITNRPSWIVYDPAHPGTFWESGIYNGGGVYETTDGGNTFSQLGAIGHIDYVSVDFSDPNRRTLLAGGHEESQTVYLSTDGGQTWTNIGLNLPAGTNFSTDPLIISSRTYVVSTQGWSGGSIGVYRTTDGGNSWQLVSTAGPTGAPLVTSTGAIYWPVNNSLLKSTDSGVTWTQVGGNLQAVHPIELPDATLAAVGATTLVISADGGSTWSPIGDTLPFAPASVIYSPSRNAFFISQWDCGNVVLPNAIMSLDYSVVPIGAPAAPTNLRFVPGPND
jgi:photosystem II stability/assembly factor-like uncharacterized protein